MKIYRLKYSPDHVVIVIPNEFPKIKYYSISANILREVDYWSFYKFYEEVV